MRLKGADRKQPAPSPKRARVFSRTRIADRRREVTRIERRHAQRLGRLIERRKGGERRRPYERVQLAGSGRWALQIFQWVLFECCVKDAPQIVGKLKEWAVWLDCSERSAWSALEWLAEEGVIVRRHFLSARRRHETGAAGPKGRRFRACGYAPSAALQVWWDEWRKNPGAPSVFTPFSQRLRSSSYSEEARSQISTLDDAPARVMGEIGVKEPAMPASQVRRLGWAQERQRRRADKESRIRWTENRMRERAARAALVAPPRPSAEPLGAGLGAAAVAPPDEKTAAVAPERLATARKPTGECDGRVKSATLDGRELGIMFCRSLLEILGE